ncbi:hypothetical protein E2651_04525 [Streptomyces sp. MZ04]|nr:hypothetical protein E2651_04525 [Streptomyces sp. MZ04]
MHTHNDLSGIVHGPVVQAGQVHGGITFNVQQAQAPGPHIRPDQVPPVLGSFVNRRDDIARLDGWFGTGRTERTRDRVGLGLLYGLRGVGKTSMVCHWAAEQGRALFPDGQIYVDFASLGGPSGGSDVSEAARKCLLSIGIGESYIPASYEDRVALFRSHSAPRRLLMVFENVSHPAQVRSLIPKGPGSVVLATSHARLGELAVSGARLLPVEPFGHTSGLELLAELCGDEAVTAEEEAARHLVELCAGLPEALSVLAARLVAGRRLTMTRLARELADESGRLAGMAVGKERSVTAVFDLTYRELSPEASRMYRLASCLPGGSFDAGAAAATAGLGTDTARSLLDALEEVRLLDMTEDDRYRFHDLVRLHARERAAQEETRGTLRAAVERMVTHYLALTAFADRAVRADRLRIADLTELLSDAPDPFAAAAADDGAPAPLDWLEAEHPNILEVLRTAFDEGLFTQVWQLSEAFTVLFLHHRHLAAWKESLELGVAAAVADPTPVPAAEARLRSLLSRPLMSLGEHEAARVELEKAVACAEVSGHPVVHASALEFAGRVWERTDLPRAMAAYRKSLELNVQGREMRGAAIATYFLGRAQDAHGDLADALETLREAHRALTACDDPRMAARVLIALGTAHERSGRTDEAITALKGAAESLRALEAFHYEAEARVAVAKILEAGDEDAAGRRALVLRAAEIYESEGNPEAEELRRWLGRMPGEGDA